MAPALNWMVRDLAKATGLRRNTTMNIEVVRLREIGTRLPDRNRVLRGRRGVFATEWGMLSSTPG